MKGSLSLHLSKWQHEEDDDNQVIFVVWDPFEEADIVRKVVGDKVEVLLSRV